MLNTYLCSTDSKVISRLIFISHIHISSIAGFAQQLVVSNHISYIDHIFCSSALIVDTPIMSSNSDHFHRNTPEESHTQLDTRHTPDPIEISVGQQDVNGLSDIEGMDTIDEIFAKISLFLFSSLILQNIFH